VPPAHVKRIYRLIREAMVDLAADATVVPMGGTGPVNATATSAAATSGTMPACVAPSAVEATPVRARITTAAATSTMTPRTTTLMSFALAPLQLGPQVTPAPAVNPNPPAATATVETSEDATTGEAARLVRARAVALCLPPGSTTVSEAVVRRLLVQFDVCNPVWG